MRGMTIKSLLQKTADRLDRSRCHGEAARLDAEVILAHALGRDRTWLIAHEDAAVPKKPLRRFRALIRRRNRHEPIAYLLGHKNFYGLRLKVNRSVLIPRPETELLVDLAIRSAGVYPPHARTSKRGTRPGATTSFFDVGTGSGAIAIALAKALPRAKIIATDVSQAALQVARENARSHDVANRITFKHTNTPPNLPSKRGGTHHDCSPSPRGLPVRQGTQEGVTIVANLPYLTTAQWRHTAPEVRNFEPRQALDGGDDGLEHYKELFDRVAATFGLRRHAPAEAGGYQLLLEIDPSEKQKMRQLVRTMLPGTRVTFHRDLAGKIRIAEIITRSITNHQFRPLRHRVHPCHPGPELNRSPVGDQLRSFGRILLYPRADNLFAPGKNGRASFA